MADQAISTETAGPSMKETYAGRAMGRAIKRRKKKRLKKAEASYGR